MKATTYSYDFFGDEFILNPIPKYTEMRAMGRVLWLQQNDVYALTHYDDVVMALRTPSIFSSARGLSLNDDVNKMLIGSTLNSDDPDHAKGKAVTARPILPKNLAPYDAMISSMADQLATDICSQREFDAVKDFAEVMPMRFVTELVGLSDAGKDNMVKWASATFNLFEGFNARAKSAFGDLVGMRKFLDEYGKPEHLDKGGLARRIFDVAPDHGFTFEQAQHLLRDYIAPSLDTTISCLGFAAYYFAKNPDQWDLLRRDPDLAVNAVEEVVRLATPIRCFSRYVTDDVTIDGTMIPKGARVLLVYASANRDPAQFENADVMDITRNTRKHVGFGHGTHSCLGMHLARREMTALLGAVIPKVKSWHVTGEPEIAMNNTIRAFAFLPMRVEIA